MSEKLKGVVLGLAGSLLVAAIGGVAAVNQSVASQQATMVGAVASGEVTVCVKKTTGAMRWLKPGKKCRRTETPLTWNTTGPQGPPGPAGPVGPTADVSALQAQVTDLATQVAALQATLAGVSRVTFQGQPTIRFSGVNVQVVDGQDEGTNGPVNGRGNLIVGWNETNGDSRAGSHNLIVGESHSYASYGGLLAGFNNGITATAPNSSVIGGAWNIAQAARSAITGGYENDSLGSYSSVSGGMWNQATAPHSSVVGGSTNTAGGDSDTVFGGDGVICNSNGKYVACGEGTLGVAD